MRGLVLISLLLIVAAGCADDPPPAAPIARDAPPLPSEGLDTVRAPVHRPPPTVPPPAFDAPTAVFDTVESPPRRTFEPPRPAPPEPPAPPPPSTRPDPPPDATTVWGRCDVRPSESFCFSYAGPGWTASDAEAHCRAAPGGAFGAVACADAQQIATCTFERPGADGQTLIYSYYAPYPVDLARLACPGEFEERD